MFKYARFFSYSSFFYLSLLIEIVKSKRFTLIPECSLESDKIRKEYSLKPNSFDVIIHEIFGYLSINN